jgi:uncharacterized cupin superfamily protein
MSGPILNVADAKVFRELSHGDKFSAKLAPIGVHIGAKKLGYNVTSVPPGKRAFPFHCHHANEEMFYVIEGTGKLRFGKDEYPVRAGDVVACPAGGPEVAHQLINTGATELRFLAVSTAIDTDIWQYPDSGKWGAVGGREPGLAPARASFAGRYVRESESLDYWDGE